MFRLEKPPPYSISRHPGRTISAPLRRLEVDQKSTGYENRATIVCTRLVAQDPRALLEIARLIVTPGLKVLLFQTGTPNPHRRTNGIHLPSVEWCHQVGVFQCQRRALFRRSVRVASPALV